MQPNALDSRAQAQSLQASQKRHRFRVPWILILAVAVMLAFQGESEMQKVLAPPSPEWSRPLAVATAASNHAFTQVALPNGRLMIVWGAEKGFHSYLISPEGKVEATAAFLEDQAAPSSVRALPGPDRVTLFWLDYATHTLWSATVAPGGRVLNPAASLAFNVTNFAVALGGEPSGPRVLALAGGTAILYAPAGGGSWKPAVVLASLDHAETVDLQGGADGMLYGVVGRRDTGSENTLRLMGIRLTAAGGADVFEVARVNLQPLKEAPGGLSLGLDKQNAYVFWDVERNDKGERSTLSRYVSWPLAEPPRQALEPQLLAVDPAGPPKASGLAKATPAPGQFDQLAVAVPATVGVGRDRVVETLELTFKGGRLVGQRLAGPSTSITLQPQLTWNGADRWLTWVVPRGSQVQLQTGSTAAAFRSAMGRITGQDWLDAIGNTVVNLGFAYLPLLISMAWVLPTIMFISVAYLLAINWAERNQLALNAVGLGIYTWLKIMLSRSLLFTPALTSKMPPALAASIAWVLVGILVVAVLELLRRNRRALQQSVASGLMPLMLYDVILTALFIAPYVK